MKMFLKRTLMTASLPLFLLFLIMQDAYTVPSPLSFNLKFEGIAKQGVFLIRLINGSKIPAKEIQVSLSVDNIDDSISKLQFLVASPDFSRQISVDASIDNNRFFLNSTPSIFTVNPNFLKNVGQVELMNIFNWKIVGQVDGVENLPTAIDKRNVEAVAITAFHYQNITKSMPLDLAYDSDTGILVYAAGIFSDPLLKEMGITQIWGGELKLSQFSDNLHFKLTTISEPSSGWETYFVWLMGMSSLLVFFSAFAYNLLKRRKRSKRSKGKAFHRTRLMRILKSISFLDI